MMKQFRIAYTFVVIYNYAVQLFSISADAFMRRNIILFVIILSNAFDKAIIIALSKAFDNNLYGSVMLK